MSDKNGVIYILTNPSFPEYVKIGYADDMKQRLAQLNRSECTPFAFRVYATYEVPTRLTDMKIHAMIDKLNPSLRAIDNVEGKKRIREFYAMTAEDAYSLFEAMAEIHGTQDKLKLAKPSKAEIRDEETASEANASSGSRRKGSRASEEDHGSAVTPLSQIEEAVISMINDNENKGKITYLGEIGSRLNDKFTDFDVRNYGYTKLVVLLQDTCPRLSVYRIDSAYAVGLSGQIDRQKLEKEILLFVKNSGGQVENLSLVYEEIHKKHPSFDIKDYGYSRLSSFLRSIRQLSVNGNLVSIKEKK